LRKATGLLEELGDGHVARGDEARLVRVPVRVIGSGLG